MSKKVDSKKEASVPSTKDKDPKVGTIKNENSNESKDEQKENKPAKLPKDNILFTSGIVEAYEYLQKQICKHGFPKGNVFEYAATQIQKFEKKHKAQKSVKIQEKLQDIKSFARSKSPDIGIADNPSLQEEKKDKKEKIKKEEPKKK